MKTMIFPTLKGKIYGYVNLNSEARSWLIQHGSNKNPLLNPAVCQEMVAAVHKKYGLDFSYGGWLEDRSVLWKGSYLEEKKKFIHLGIDINVPVGTDVATDFDAEVVSVDCDYPDEGGWGTTVILKSAVIPVYIIYAHLAQKVSCKNGDSIKKGTIFAQVGAPPFNGNWFPPLHVQTMSPEYYAELDASNNWSELDGYGKAEDIERLARMFKDPLEFISLK